MIWKRPSIKYHRNRIKYVMRIEDGGESEKEGKINTKSYVRLKTWINSTMVVPMAVMAVLVFFVHKHVLALHSCTIFFNFFFFLFFPSFIWNVSLNKIAMTIYFLWRGYIPFTQAHIHTPTHRTTFIDLTSNIFNLLTYSFSPFFSLHNTPFPLSIKLKIFQSNTVSIGYPIFSVCVCVCAAFKSSTTVSMTPQCVVVNVVTASLATAAVAVTVAAAWKSKCCGKLFSESKRK